MKDLLQGFSGNFGGSGVGPDPSTLLGLIEWTRLWSEGTVSTDRLISAIGELTERCLRAARETARDLEDEETLEPSLVDTLEGLKECFEDTTDELTRFLIQLRNNQAVEENVQALQSLQEEISQLSRCLEGWTSCREPLCVRCGSKGPEITCRQGQLERLVPDPQPEPDVRSAHLGPQYLTLYQAYRDIINGDRSLATLEGRLQPLETELRQMLRLSRESGFPLQTEAELGLRGLAQMRTALSSRRTSDLNEGWSQVFSCAAALMEKLPDLLRQSGRPAEARDLENSRRFEDNTR